MQHCVNRMQLQYGADNPFALLHDHIGRLLSLDNTPPPYPFSSANNNEDICAIGYTLISPSKPNENDEIVVKLRIDNKKRDPLLNVRVSLEMLRERPDTTLIQFRIGPLTFEGIRSLDGDAHLPANSSFTAQWLIRPVHSSRLMNVARYQVHFLMD
uniref:Uncharacterized protein n=1 Tax=Parascaris equorum TaxID=6256 RepID=A0A914RBM4_PAREQ